MARAATCRVERDGEQAHARSGRDGAHARLSGPGQRRVGCRLRGTGNCSVSFWDVQRSEPCTHAQTSDEPEGKRHGRQRRGGAPRPLALARTMAASEAVQPAREPRQISPTLALDLRIRFLETLLRAPPHSSSPNSSPTSLARRVAHIHEALQQALETPQGGTDAVRRFVQNCSSLLVYLAEPPHLPLTRSVPSRRRAQLAPSHTCTPVRRARTRCALLFRFEARPRPRGRTRPAHPRARPARTRRAR